MMAREFYVKIQEPNPTGSRPTDLIGLCEPTKKERQGGQGKPNRRKGAAGRAREQMVMLATFVHYHYLPHWLRRDDDGNPCASIRSQTCTHISEELRGWAD